MTRGNASSKSNAPAIATLSTPASVGAIAGAATSTVLDAGETGGGGDADSSHGEADASRAGADDRRRGWFWHWNSVVTQYSPLLGLKGVGLLNSYTVWTDRREESPHRGYAFPSQQSEADFYGEERAELITINKILVTLNLIEIRKEMIQRTDERGRKWRVPHNLYRVRDRDDGMQLRASDVLRVADLATRDPAVFRYVRRIFSERFKPIDRDNVWHAILIEIDSHPTWQELRVRNQAIEHRASARTRAGHRTRSGRGTEDSGAELTVGQLDCRVLVTTEQCPLVSDELPASVGATNDGLEVSPSPAAATGNTGFMVDAEPSNDGLAADSASMSARVNTGRPSSVGRGNTTYHQPQSTTTTTTTRRGLLDETAIHADAAGGQSPTALRSNERAVVHRRDGEHSIHQQYERAENPVTTDNAIGTPEKSPTATESHDAQPGQREQREQPEPFAQMGRGNDDERNEASATSAARAGNQVDTGTLLPDRLPTGQPDDRGGADAERSTRNDSLTGVATVARNVAPSHAPHADSPNADAPPDANTGRDYADPAGGGAHERRPDHADADAGGPLGDPSPLVVSLFEAANDRRAKPLERTLLAELERDADPAAHAAGSNGSAWVAAALREAVASGSSFVAPKRIREIVARWAQSGMPQPTPLGQTTERGRAPRTQPAAAIESTRPAASANESGAATTDNAGDVRLPGGRSGGTTWTAVLIELRRTLDHAAFERLLAGSAIVRYWRGTVEIAVGSAAASEKLSTEYRALIERQLNARLRHPVSITFVVAPVASPDEDDADGPHASIEATYPTTAAEGTNTSVERLLIAPDDLDLGRQLWRAALDDLRTLLPADDRDAIASGAVLGEDVTGALLIAGVASPAQRLIESRHRLAIEAALTRLLGRAVTLRCLAPTGWAVQPHERSHSPA